MSMTAPEFASHLGLTPQTVARALRDDSRVKPETRRRVKDAASRLGYRPNAVAVQLRRQVPSSVGLVVAHPSDHADAAATVRRALPMVQSFAHHLEENGFHLMLGMVSSNIAEEMIPDRLPAIIRDGHANCLAVLSAMWPKLSEAIKRMGIPAVVLDGPAYGLPAVQRDEVAAMEAIVDHLVEMGHRRIAYFASSAAGSAIPHAEPFRGDLWPRGYLKAMTRHQLVPVPGWDESRPLAKALHDTLSLDDPPTAIIAYDELELHHMMRVLEQRGLHVPGDMSLATLREMGIPGGLEPRATLIDIPQQAIAKAGAEMISRLASDTVRGQHRDFPETLSFKGALREGHTTAPPRPGTGS